MAGAVDIIMLGDKELAAKLKTLTDKLQKKVVRMAMRAAIRPVAAYAKAHAPVLSGTLQLSLKVMARKFKNRNKFGVQVTTAGLDGADIFYAAFNEFGTHPPGVTKAFKKSTEARIGAGKRQPARPFMRPASHSTREQQMSILKQEIGAGIERVARESGSAGGGEEA